MNKLATNVLHIIDAGLHFNLELGGSVYKPGEIIQVDTRVNGERVFIEVRPLENSFRVAFGDNPEYGKRLSKDEAVQVIKNH